MPRSYTITIASSTLIEMAQKRTLAEYRWLRVIRNVPNFPTREQLRTMNARERWETSRLLHNENTPEGRREIEYTTDFLLEESVTELQLLCWALYAPPRVQIFMDALTEDQGGTLGYFRRIRAADGKTISTSVNDWGAIEEVIRRLNYIPPRFSVRTINYYQNSVAVVYHFPVFEYTYTTAPFGMSDEAYGRYNAVNSQNSPAEAPGEQVVPTASEPSDPDPPYRPSRLYWTGPPIRSDFQDRQLPATDRRYIAVNWIARYAEMWRRFMEWRRRDIYYVLRENACTSALTLGYDGTAAFTAPGEQTRRIIRIMEDVEEEEFRGGEPGNGEPGDGETDDAELGAVGGFYPDDYILGYGRFSVD